MLTETEKQLRRSIIIENLRILIEDMRLPAELTPSRVQYVEDEAKQLEHALKIGLAPLAKDVAASLPKGDVTAIDNAINEAFVDAVYYPADCWREEYAQEPEDDYAIDRAREDRFDFASEMAEAFGMRRFG